MGFFSFIGDVVGGLFGRPKNVQNQTLDSTIENEFSPNVVVNTPINGLEELGSAIGDGFETFSDAVIRASALQSQSNLQSGLNVSNAIDGAGLNLSGAVNNGADALGESVSGAGANIAFGAIVGASIITMAAAGSRD